MAQVVRLQTFYTLTYKIEKSMQYTLLVLLNAVLTLKVLVATIDALGHFETG